MKKYGIFLLLLAFIAGCSTTIFPLYLKDTKPYMKRFYADFDKMNTGLRKTLDELGWKIQKETLPSVYEQAKSSDLDEEQLLLITEVRQMPMFMGTRSAKMNVYLRSKQGISEIEIRYLSVTELPFKSFKTYSNDAAAQRILDKLQKAIDEM